MTSYAVGHTIRFEATFVSEGVPYDPTTVVLNLNFFEGDARVQREIDMDSEGSGVFTALFDTEWANPGLVYWDIRNLDKPTAVTYGRFFLKRSPAAPEPLS
jgi:hypothetical protein